MVTSPTWRGREAGCSESPAADVDAFHEPLLIAQDKLAFTEGHRRPDLLPAGEYLGTGKNLVRCFRHQLLLAGI